MNGAPTGCTLAIARQSNAIGSAALAKMTGATGPARLTLGFSIGNAIDSVDESIRIWIESARAA